MKYKYMEEKIRIEKAREEMQEKKQYNHSEKYLHKKESKIKEMSYGFLTGDEERDLKQIIPLAM